MIHWAYWLLVFIAVQRGLELLYAMRNTRRLLAGGGREVGPGHYPLFILLHGSWLICLAWLTTPAPPVLWPLITLFFVLQSLRIWVIASLGPYWTTRIITLDHEPVKRRGPYRFIRHPNYLLVALEVPLVPLILDLPAIAILFGVLNILLLGYRIQVEDETLAPRRSLPPLG